MDSSVSCVVHLFWKAPPASPVPACRAPHPLDTSRQPSPFSTSYTDIFPDVAWALVLESSLNPLSQMALTTPFVIRSHWLSREHIQSLISAYAAAATLFLEQGPNWSAGAFSSSPVASRRDTSRNPSGPCVWFRLASDLGYLSIPSSGCLSASRLSSV